MTLRLPVVHHPALHAIVLGLWFGAAAGCGSRAAPNADGALSPDGTVQPDGTRADGRRPIPSGPCGIGIRVDNCCTIPQPVAASALDGRDPCLVSWPPGWNGIPQLCLDRWDPMCATIDCSLWVPPSRLVGVGADGRCEWKSECATDADCVFKIDARECCPCGRGYPKALVADDPCIVDPIRDTLQPWPPPGCKDACWPPPACEPCPDLPPVYPPSRCEAGSDPAYRTCMPWSP